MPEKAESEKTAGRMFSVLPAVFCRHPCRKAGDPWGTERDVAALGRQPLPQKNEIADLMIMYNIVLLLLH